jgi:hypothetical protein
VSERARTGRPLKEHQPGTLVNITLQVPAELKNRLQEHALKSNRTLSAEAQRRLERSFSFKGLQEDAIVLAVERAFAAYQERLAKQMEDMRATLEKEAEQKLKELGLQSARLESATDKHMAELQQQLERLQGRSRTK